MYSIFFFYDSRKESLTVKIDLSRRYHSFEDNAKYSMNGDAFTYLSGKKTIKKLC